MQYTAADFMDADISITVIHDVFEAENTRWAMPVKVVRKKEGLLFFLEGSIQYEMGATQFHARPGQVVRLPAGIPYNGHRLDVGPLRYHLIDFNAGEGEYDRFPLPYSFTPSDPAEVLTMIRQLEDNWQHPTLCSRLSCKQQLTGLLVYLAKDHAVNACKYDARSRILRYCEYLQKHLEQPEFRISELSQAFDRSETSLRRLFREEMGISPSEYLIRLRIHKARQLLSAQNDLTVQQVAAMCGYASIYYFSAAFRDRTGVSPSEYRSRML